MNDMNKEFLPYEEALALKELGFDTQCFAHYRDKESLVACNQGIYGISYSDIEAPTKVILAPLYQQAFRFFRKKYNLHILINVKDGIWYFERFSINGFNTYEEAEQACLDKLIKIVKNNNK